MADARAILDERLAKGEISVDEHSQLISRLGNKTGSSENASHSAGTPDKIGAVVSSMGNKIWTGFQVLGGIVLIVFLVRFFTGPSSDGLTVGNIDARYSSVRLDIVNNSSKAGDVLIWVNKDGIRKCDSLIRMKAKWKITNLSIPCTLSQGKFSVHYIWASGDKARASIAKRVN